MVGLREEVGEAVLLATCSPSRVPSKEVGEEPPEDAFLDNKDWKKLAKTSWEGPPGCPAPLPVSMGGKDEAVEDGNAEDADVADGIPNIPLLPGVPEAEIDWLEPDVN